MPTINSTDGTPIAFDITGSGPAVILVNGAIAHRAMDPTMAQLADLLGAHFTVYNFDRRGRGESGDTLPFTPNREIEDIQSLISHAGGSAMIFAISSGAVLTLDAAAVTPSITHLVLYEPPFIVDDTRAPVPDDYAQHLADLAAQGKRDEAVEYFLTKAVGIPPEYVGGARQDQASWSGMLAVAHTIAYDAAYVGDVMRGQPLPKTRWSSVTIPTLVADGGASDAWMHNAADALAGVLPHAARATLAEQTHMVDPIVLAPIIIDFFNR